MGSGAGVVVRALTSHQYGQGSILARCHMWVKFVVGSRLTLRVSLRGSQVFDQDKGLCNERFLCGTVRLGRIWNISPGGGGVLPYMGYIGVCRCEGYGFQAVYFRIGYINQSVWV